MHPSSATGPSIAAFTSQFDEYLLRVRGSADSTRRLHRQVVHRFFTARFPNGVITWSDLLQRLRGVRQQGVYPVRQTSTSNRAESYRDHRRANYVTQATAACS